MTLSLFSVAMLFIIISAVTVETFRGAKNGFTKAATTLATLCLSLVLALILSPRLSQGLGSELAQVIKRSIGYGTSIAQSQYMNIFLNALSGMIVSSVFFLVVFAVIRILLVFFVSRLNRIAKKRNGNVETDDKTPQSKKRGAAIGAVCGVIMAVIITSPIMGTLNAAKKIVNFVERADWTMIADESTQKEVSAIRKYANDGVGNVLYNLGGNLIYSSAASTTVNGKTVYLVNELDNMRLVLEDFLFLFPILQDPASANETYAERIDQLCEHLKDIKLCDVLIANYLPEAANAWLRGESFLKIERPDVGELLTPTFDGILSVCAQTNMYTVKDDTISLLRIYSLLLKSGILQTNGDYSSLLRCIEETNLLEKLEAELDKNPNMQPIKRYTAEIAMRMIAEEIHTHKFNEKNYNELKENLAYAIETILSKGYGTQEEMIEAMTTYTQDYLKDYGITVPSSLAEPIAEVMLTRINTNETVTPEAIEEFLKSYLN